MRPETFNFHNILTVRENKFLHVCDQWKSFHFSEVDGGLALQIDVMMVEYQLLLVVEYFLKDFHRLSKRFNIRSLKICSPAGVKFRIRAPISFGVACNVGISSIDKESFPFLLDSLQNVAQFQIDHVAITLKGLEALTEFVRKCNRVRSIIIRGTFKNRSYSCAKRSLFNAILQNTSLVSFEFLDDRRPVFDDLDTTEILKTTKKNEQRYKIIINTCCLILSRYDEMSISKDVAYLIARTIFVNRFMLLA
jgi:hypothetical protein